MSKTSFRVSKVDEFEQRVFGWASVDKIVDHQDQIIPPEELEEAVYEYNLLWRDADEKHTAAVKGKLIESFVVTPAKLEAMGLKKNALPEGWWVGFHIPDERVFQKVVDGDYQMFSIAGTAVQEESEDDEDD